jgi:hypothetical protein
MPIRTSLPNARLQGLQSLHCPGSAVMAPTKRSIRWPQATHDRTSALIANVGPPHHEQGSPARRSVTAKPGAAHTGHGLRNRRTRSRVARLMARMRVGLRCARMSVSTKAVPYIPITRFTAFVKSAGVWISLISARAGAGC